MLRLVSLLTRTIFPASLALFPVIALAGQADPSPQAPDRKPYTFTQTSHAVVLDVAVIDRRGHFVPGLKASDFHVEENGVNQKVRFFESVETHTLPNNLDRGLSGAPLLKASGDAPNTKPLTREQALQDILSVPPARRP